MGARFFPNAAVTPPHSLEPRIAWCNLRMQSKVVTRYAIFMKR